jgi:hypothetical protein
MRKGAFWLAVAGTAVLANFAMEMLSDALPSGSFRQFVQYLHRGPAASGGQQ